MTAYELRISDWSSDVCSSDLGLNGVAVDQAAFFGFVPDTPRAIIPVFGRYDTLFTLPERNHTKTRVASATVDYEITPAIRSEARRVGKECVSTCSYSGAAYH